MKTTKTKLIIASMVTLVVSVMLSSFEITPGGDSFTIYLNDKLLVQQYVHLKEKTKTVSLQQASAEDVVRIHYSHCGKMGISRNLIIKDQNSKTLKAWKFEDAQDGDKGAMRISVGDIRKLEKASGNKTLTIVYSSEQLPYGLVLANVVASAQVEASVK